MKLKFLLDRGYYKYLYYRLKRKQIGDYIFFDPATSISILLPYLVALAYLFPGKVTLRIPTANTQIYILENFSRNISIFFGIMFSFVILSFNIFYRYFGRYAFLAFFRNKTIKVSFTILVAAVSSSIYTSAFLKDLPVSNSFSNFMYCFSLLLCAIATLWIFPSVVLLLNNAHNRENIKDLFKRLNEDWLVDEFEARVERKSLHTFYQKDPISILSEIGSAAVKEFDLRTIQVLTKSLEDFFSTNILAQNKTPAEGVDGRNIYMQFQLLLNNVYQVSIKERNELASLNIINTRFRMESLVLKSLNTTAMKEVKDHNDQYKHWTLDFDLKEYFTRAIQFNEDLSSKSLIDNYQHFVTESIPKLIPSGFTYRRQQNYESAFESDFMFNPMRVVNELIPLITSSKKIDLFKPIFTFYFCLEGAILRLDVNNETKCFFFTVLLNYKFDAFQKFITALGTDRITNSTYPFSWTSTHYEHTECANIVYASFKTIRFLFSEQKLNLVAINAQKAEMLGLLGLFPKHPSVVPLIIRSIDLFTELKGFIEANPSSDYKKETYLHLQENLRIVQSSYLSQDERDPRLTEAFTSAIESFHEKDTYTADLDGKGYMRDDRII